MLINFLLKSIHFARRSKTIIYHLRSKLNVVYRSTGATLRSALHQPVLRYRENCISLQRHCSDESFRRWEVRRAENCQANMIHEKKREIGKTPANVYRACTVRK